MEPRPRLGDDEVAVGLSDAAGIKREAFNPVE